MAAAATANSAVTNSAIVGTTCMELALEGERLCKTGDFKNGVRFFEEAIKVGTDDDRTLSAIYSQLGNAYFYMEDFQKALEYHKQDVTLVHSIGDEAAEAKACGNLGNSFKMLSKFDEAAVYCRRYLEISRKLNDKIGEGRALYNLGNVYHTQGKRMIGSSAEQEPGELSNDIKSSLLRAIEYYEMNLKVVSELNDFASMGRAYGNLGNTHYLLGNFEQAIVCHSKRLELARQTNDKSAERRAHLNLGNANVFLGNFPEAVDNYSATLKLAQELQDRATEAHSCYSLANTFTFLRDYKSAINYHLKYLEMIKEFENDESDKLGEGRACWSLVNIYQMVNDPESALIYARRHYEIAELLGDKAGLASARLNIEELQEIISQKQAAQLASANSAAIHLQQQHQIETSGSSSSKRFTTESVNKFTRLTPDKRQEQEQRRFKKQLNSNLAADIDGLAARRRNRGERGAGGPVRSSSNERLFDMIAHFQSGRIDDQRCEILKNSTGLFNTEAKTRRTVVDDKENLVAASNGNSNGSESTINNNRNFGALASGGRGSQPSIGNPMNAVTAAASAIKATYRKASLVAYPTSNAPSIQSQRRPTVSAEHREQLFDLIAGAQGQRMDEQRASLPAFTVANGVLKNPMSAGLLTRGHTIDQSSSSAVTTNTNQTNKPASGRQVGALPETIIEANAARSQPNSYINQQHQPQSTTATTTNSNNTNTTSASSTATTTTTTTSKPKLTRHFQTMDPADAQVHDEKFLDSLMKYQSTRFNDQRVEFPNKKQDTHQVEPDNNKAGQADNFFNLIVRFQSDRIDDQRSAPPTRNKQI